MENNSNAVTQLSNGITLHIKEFPITPLAGMTFKIHLTDHEKTGLPHLVEHVLINQTKTPDFIKLSGSTDLNSISIKMIGKNKDLVNFSQYFLNKLFTFKIKTKSLQNEKAVVIQEIRQYGNSKLEKFANIARNCSFKDSNLFDDDVLGNFNTITNVTTQDIYEFLNYHLIKNNISVLIAGDCLTLHQLKDNIGKYTLKVCSSAANSIIENLSQSENLIFKKTIIGNQDQKQSSQLSFIFKIDSNRLNEEKILALSMLFSLLNMGTYSLLSQMQHFVPELYYFQAIPIFRRKNIYLQLLSSCNIQDTKIIENQINTVFSILANLDLSDLKNIIHNIKFQQNLLFDGVEKSISSFANMPLEQEKITNLSDINAISISKKFKEITTDLIDQKRSTVIAYI